MIVSLLLFLCVQVFVFFMKMRYAKVVFAKIFQRGRLLGLKTIVPHILLKQVFYEDVGQDVLTCWYDSVAYLVSHSWRFFLNVRSQKILQRFDSRGMLTKKRVFPRSRDRRFSFVVFLKCDVVTFKETIYMLQEYCAEDRVGSAVCLARFAHQAHYVSRLYIARLKI